MHALLKRRSCQIKIGMELKNNIFVVMIDTRLRWPKIRVTSNYTLRKILLTSWRRFSTVTVILMFSYYQTMPPFNIWNKFSA